MIPAILGAVAAVAGIFSGGGGGQTRQQAQALEEQIDIEKKLYELQQDTRLWQMNEQSWQNTRERLQRQIDRRNQILSSRLNQRAARTNRVAQTADIKDAAFQADQQRVLQEQGLQAQAEQVGLEQQGIMRQGGEALGQIPDAQAVPNSDALNVLMQMEAAQLARESILGEVVNQAGTVHSRMLQDQSHARNLFDAQQALQAGALTTQQKLVNLERRTAARVEGVNRKGINTEYAMARKAARANLLADRALKRNMTRAERAEHEARVASLEAAMPVQQSNVGAKIGGVLQGLAPLAGQLLASGGAGQSGLRFDKRFQMQPYSGTPNSVSYTPGSAGISGRSSVLSPSVISTPPPSAPRIYSGFPTSLNNIG